MIMKKDPNEQLSFDFALENATARNRSMDHKIGLKLVHCSNIGETANRNDEALEREKILSSVVSYARKLAW